MFFIRVLIVSLWVYAVLETFKPCTRGSIRVRNLLRNDPILNTYDSHCSVFNMMSLSENTSQRKNSSYHIFFFVLGKRASRVVNAFLSFC